MYINGTGIEFTYDPNTSPASTRQLTHLLEGFGYDRVTCVADDDTEMVVVVAQKFMGCDLKNNSHEFEAICHVLGQWIEIAYFKLRATEMLVYSQKGRSRVGKL